MLKEIVVSLQKKACKSNAEWHTGLDYFYPFPILIHMSDHYKPVQSLHLVPQPPAQSFI